MVAELITLQAYAELNGVPYRTVQTRARQGQIPTFRIGSAVLIEKSTPWEARKVGKPTNAERRARESKVGSRPSKLRIKITRAYYVTVEDATGKEYASDFCFGTKEDSKRVGERLKAEVERGEKGYRADKALRGTMEGKSVIVVDEVNDIKSVSDFAKFGSPEEIFQ